MRANTVTTTDLHQSSMADPEYAAEWKRTEIAEYLALKVLKYRTDHGWSQREAGRQWNLPQSAIARIEAGDHQPTIGTLEKFANLLDQDFTVAITRQSGARLLSA